MRSMANPWEPQGFRQPLGWSMLSGTALSWSPSTGDGAHWSHFFPVWDSWSRQPLLWISWLGRPRLCQIVVCDPLSNSAFLHPSQALLTSKLPCSHTAQPLHPGGPARTQAIFVWTLRLRKRHSAESYSPPRWGVLPRPALCSPCS